MPATRAVPRPEEAGDAAAFLALLRRLQRWSGLPVEELEARVRAAGVLIPGGLSGLLGGDVLPSREAVVAFVTACGLVPEEREKWTDAHDRIGSAYAPPVTALPSGSLPPMASRAGHGPVPRVEDPLTDPVTATRPDPVTATRTDPVTATRPDPVTATRPDPPVVHTRPMRIGDPVRPVREAGDRLVVAKQALNMGASAAWKEAATAASANGMEPEDGAQNRLERAAGGEQGAGPPARAERSPGPRHARRALRPAPGDRG
ncbi:helix-turn-helix domain-containing protein, partial [Actinomadura fibrosa]